MVAAEGVAPGFEQVGYHRGGLSLFAARAAGLFWQRPRTSVQLMSAVLQRHWDEVSAALRIGNARRLKLLLGRYLKTGDRRRPTGTDAQ
jgi:hypothetical protein